MFHLRKLDIIFFLLILLTFVFVICLHLMFVNAELLVSSYSSFVIKLI